MPEFDNDRDEVIRRAQRAGVDNLITIGSDLAGTLRGVELASQYDNIYAAAGIHPHDAKDFTDDTLATLRDLTAATRVVAIGETGLDYHYDHSPREVQKKVFEQHIILAAEQDLPVVIHCREADEDVLSIVRSAAHLRGVFHCFAGDLHLAEAIMKMGFFISVAGPVTFRKSQQLQDLIRHIPDEHLLVETDAPYLAPEPFRGKRNEPSFIIHTASRIAELRGVTLHDIARITTLNAKRLFNIGSLPDVGAIAYRIRDSLYLNITNRCTNRCSFCVRFRSDYVKGHRLRISHEPTADELKEAIGNPEQYAEIVFCGYGEPFERLDVVTDVARWVKKLGGRVRINTNGHGNLINGRDIIPELKGIVDSISISLDAQDRETYDRICRPSIPGAFDAVIDFIRRAGTVIPDLQVTVVSVPGVDIEQCRKLAEGLGARFRVREHDVVG